MPLSELLNDAVGQVAGVLRVSPHGATGSQPGDELLATQIDQFNREHLISHRNFLYCLPTKIIENEIDEFCDNASRCVVSTRGQSLADNVTGDILHVWLQPCPECMTNDL